MIGDTLRQFGRSFARAPVAWLGMLVVATGTDLVDLVYGVTGSGFSNIQIVSFAIRIVGVFWLAAVAIRQMVGSPAQPWSLDRGFLFLFVWQIAGFVLQTFVSVGLAVVKNFAAPVIPFAIDPYVLTLIFIALATPIVDLLSLRISPWLVGRTSCDADRTFKAAWRGMRGNWSAAAVTYVVLVLPLFAIHYTLTAWLQHTGAGRQMSQQIKLEWTLFDGVESIVMLMLLLSLFVVCYGRAKQAS